MMLDFDLSQNFPETNRTDEVETMHPDLEKLMILQTHDIEAKRLRDELVALPKLVASLEATLKSVQGQRAVIVELITKEEVLRRSQESDIKDHKAKADRIRKQLDLATTTVQVTAFEHQIAFEQGEVSRLEDAELDSMERSEGLEGQRKLADDAVSDAGKILDRERIRAAETVAADKVALATVDTARQALRPQISEAALSTYDRIAKGKGTAVAEAVNQKCMACQMMVRPQRWNDLRDRSNDDDMMTCESCGRLLYYDPARDAPQRKTVPVESIAASIIRSL
ncbi:zinc ribbon domain-containing protein [Granulicella arctica]|uniref:zinc ribbon domain-containing protein n=1 Tax=Granulicella arctica TaxID=940613 RepID=UPI0021E062CD|nr:C4-type zinc ribbon domain-containing protein [Granulicella arctica]